LTNHVGLAACSMHLKDSCAVEHCDGIHVYSTLSTGLVECA